MRDFGRGLAKGLAQGAVDGALAFPLFLLIVGFMRAF